MPELKYNNGVKLEVGTTVKVLTTAACESEEQFRKKLKDIEKDKEVKDPKSHKHNKDHHDPKDAWKDLECKDHDWKDFDDCHGKDECKDDKDCKEHKVAKDPTGIFTGVILGEAELGFKRDCGEHATFPPIVVAEKEQYLVLSLTRSSPPFAAGEVISLSFDQIVAIAVVCS